jgi:hypothetical protein
VPPQPGESVIWIKVSKPTLDLVGLVLSSVGATSILIGIALLLGVALGLSLILRRRHQGPGQALEPVSLDLDRA